SASQVVKPTPGTTGTTYNGPAKTGSRGPVSTANHWKLVGGVVSGLIVIVVAAMLFQHRTPELPDDPATQSKPASSSAATFNRKTAQSQDAQDAQEPGQAEGRSHTSSRASKSARNAAVAPVAPPAPAEGQLIVSSLPMGATVEIEGRTGQQWKAPQTVPGLAAGTYKVTFSMPGYATETR